MTDSPNLAAGFMVSVASLILWGVVFSVVAVTVARRFTGRVVWFGWMLLVTILTILGTAAFHRSFPAGAGGVWITVYMLGMFIGIPTAVVALVATRIGRRVPARTWAVHFALTFLAYLAAIPVALVIGAIPDAARMF